MEHDCATCKTNPKGDFCPSCGRMLDSNNMVNEVGFQNQNVVGRFGNQSNSYSHIRGFQQDQRLKKATKQSKILGNELNLNQLQLEQGLRLFKWAQHNNFTHGRNTSHVMAACLYIVCRQQKTPHLLIDFADCLGINLYQLGATFLKMANMLHFEGEKLPIIDPSLFIHRFCNRLDFGEQQNQVAMTALKLLARMKRDWMCYGRRPTSLCGAAILIAARYHGFKRTTNQIVQTVRVCDETIRKRLEEFKQTQVAQLTREQFETLDLEKDLIDELDPPSFTKTLKDSGKVIEKITDLEESLQSKAIKIENQLKIQSQDDSVVDQSQEKSNDSQIICYQEQQQSQEKQISNPELDFENVNLSDVSDSEIDQLILSPEEKSLKSIMWHKMHKDWLQQQHIKKQLKEKKKKGIKKRTKTVNQIIDADGPVQALFLHSKLKDKVNKEVLENIFDNQQEEQQIIQSSTKKVKIEL